MSSTAHWVFALLVTFGGLAWSSTAGAYTTFALPYSEDFDSLQDLDADGFMCPQAENRCDFQANQNGTSYEFLLDFANAYAGKNALRFILDFRIGSKKRRLQNNHRP